MINGNVTNDIPADILSITSTTIVGDLDNKTSVLQAIEEEYGTKERHKEKGS